MKIHSDKLAASDLYRAVPEGVNLQCAPKGSRKRKHAFDVSLAATPGEDAHGIKRVFAQNSGRWGAEDAQFIKAATWIEWGDWMVELFKLDPEAIVGYYDGSHDFIVQTQEAAPHRPAREDAERHADRWSEELFWAAEEAKGNVKITRVGGES